ncbi:MAG: site-specific integrase [Bradymonadales bacterium]|nr:site-specific integrase [Bradymonadales bacterium]
MKKTPGIKKLPDGRYQLRATATSPHTGTKIYRKKIVDPMSREDLVIAQAQLAKALKEELQKEAEAQEEARPEANNPVTRPQPQRRIPYTREHKTTVADYAERWTRTRVSRLKHSAQQQYINALADRILPILVGRPIREITRNDVEEWVIWAERLVNRKTGRRYAQDTLLAWWRPMVTMLRDAAAELDFRDPTLRVRPPRSAVRNTREKQTLTPKELGQVIEVARSRPDWFAEIYTLAYTGMRAGELYALRWEDVDFERRCISVQRSVWKGHEGTTKTGSSREVAMPAPLWEVLWEYQVQQLRRKKGGIGSWELVFPNQCGTFRRADSLRKILRQIGKAAGLNLKLGPQVFRRTLNTLLLEGGVDQIIIRSQMGHTSSQMTERYAGVHIDRKEEAVAQLIKESSWRQADPSDRSDPEWPRAVARGVAREN